MLSAAAFFLTVGRDSIAPPAVQLELVCESILPTNTDALIIGGGPAGSTLALLLARAGWRVLVVERKAFPRRKVCGEYLSATNWPLLAELGLADAFERLAGPAVTEVGLLAGRATYRAGLPQPGASATRWGRALAREHLDTLLLEAAARAGRWCGNRPIARTCFRPAAIWSRGFTASRNHPRRFAPRS